MKIELIHVFPEGRDVLKTDENYWVLSEGKVMIYKLDRVTIEQVFYSMVFPKMIALDYTKRYVFMFNITYGVECYDVKTKKLLSTMNYHSAFDANPTSFCPCFDNPDEVFVIAGRNKAEEASIHNFMDANYEYTLLRYHLPEFTLVDQLVFKESFTDIIPIPFLKKYLLVSDKGEFYLFDGKEISYLAIRHKSDTEANYLVDNNKRELLLEENNGIRFYNENFSDINRITLINEEPKLSENESLSTFLFIRKLQNENQGLSGNIKEGIIDMDFYKEDTLIVYVSEALRLSSAINIYNRKDGERLTSFPLGSPAANFHVFGDEITMTANGRLFILKVSDDD